MGVSSERPLIGENVPAPFFAQGGLDIDPNRLEDDEFPSNLPLVYDRMLQSGWRRRSTVVTNLIVFGLAALLIFFSWMVYHLPNSSPSVLASPSSPK